MIRRFRRRLQVALQRAMPLLALAGFLAGMIGMPVPQPAFTGKDRSRPFPCMNRQCGCANADQCWRGCCCFTNREKLAWAKEHCVTPPDLVVEFAAREKPVAQTTNCCAAKQRKNCCAHAREDAGLTIGFVTAIQARKCQGQAQLWLALGAAMPPPGELSPDLHLAECGAVRITSWRLLGVSLSPATPPPRA